MADLSRQHGDLPAVVGVVRDQVPEKSSCIGAEASDAAIARQGPVEYCAQSQTAVFEREPGLRGSYCGAIQLLRDLLSLRGFQPHHPYVMQAHLVSFVFNEFQSVGHSCETARHGLRDFSVFLDIRLSQTDLRLRSAKDETERFSLRVFGRMRSLSECNGLVIPVD